MPREYEKTHPWITFQFDANRLDYRTWMLLGRIQALCQYIREAPIDPDVRSVFHRVYLAKGALATVAIEGNTLTEEQVQELVEGVLELPPSQEYLGQQVQNILDAYTFVKQRALGGTPPPFSVDLIKGYHYEIMKDTPVSEDVVLGQIRQSIVRVGSYVGVPVADCAYLLDRLCDLLNEDWVIKFDAPEAYRLAFAALKAIFAHVYFVWIHPFADGNGRVARLLEFAILVREGFPDVVAHMLTNHYNLTREEYYRQLARTSASGGDLSAFITYALQGFSDGLDEQLGRIQMWQLHIHWQHYVHRIFDDDSKKERRLRHLLLDLWDAALAKPVPITAVRYITPRVAEDYANLVEKTLRRDIQELVEAEMIVRDEAGIRPNFDRLRVFLPRFVEVSSPPTP